MWPRSSRDGVRLQGLSLDPSEAPSAGIYHSILSTRDTYRLALKGILPPSPSALTDYRFSCTATIKRHRGLAARQSVPLVCFLSGSFVSFLFLLFVRARPSGEATRPRHLWRILALASVSFPESSASNSCPQGLTRLVDGSDVISSWRFSLCQLSVLSSLIRKR